MTYRIPIYRDFQQFLAEFLLFRKNISQISDAMYFPLLYHRNDQDQINTSLPHYSNICCTEILYQLLLHPNQIARQSYDSFYLIFYLFNAAK